MYQNRLLLMLKIMFITHANSPCHFFILILLIQIYIAKHYSDSKIITLQGLFISKQLASVILLLTTLN